MREALDEHLLENKSNRKLKGKRYNILLILLLVGAVISTGIAWFEVESIIGSGPIMSLIGIIFSIVAYKIDEKLSVFIGLIPLLISIVWLFSIEKYDLSPGDCEFTVPLSLSISTGLIFCIGFYIFIKDRQP